MILRALGENPAALDSAGYNVFALRYAYVTFGSIMTAVSGAVVSLAYTISGDGAERQGLIAFSYRVRPIPDSDIRCSSRDQHHRIDVPWFPRFVLFSALPYGGDRSPDLYYRKLRGRRSAALLR